MLLRQEGSLSSERMPPAKGLETRDPRGAAEPSEAARERAAPSITRRACVRASSRIAALPLPAGIRAAIMIFVLTHYIIIRIFLCEGALWCRSHGRDVFLAFTLQRIPGTPLTPFRLSSAWRERGSEDHQWVLRSNLTPQSVTKIHRAQLVLRPQRSGLSQSWTEQTLRSFTHQNF